MSRGHFSPKTAQFYELLLRRHLLPTFGDINIADIRQEDARAWRAQRLREGPQQERPFGPAIVAKAHRPLRAILNTAMRDKRVRENPCQIKGADPESSPERPVLSVAEVYRLAEAIEPRYRALILLATFGNLRSGELGSDWQAKLAQFVTATCWPGRAWPSLPSWQRCRSARGHSGWIKP